MTDIEYRTVEGATWADLQGGDRVTAIRIVGDPSKSVLKVERPVPKVELPTVPGHYLDKDGNSWDIDSYVIEYRFKDDWDFYYSLAPFTRLYTLSDAAEIIADWVEETGWRGPQMIRRGFVDGAK